MLYDMRMGPIALDAGDRIAVAYQACRNDRLGHPHVIVYDKKEQHWGSPVRIGAVNKYDHHFAPILWLDDAGHWHTLYQCHGKPHESIHKIARSLDLLEAWQDAPEMAQSISYPRVFQSESDRAVFFYRVRGHLGYWTCKISEDGGATWGDEFGPLVNFSDAPKDEVDRWAGSYHAARLSPDGRDLHLGFVYWDERRLANPVYGVRTGTNTRFHLYYLRVNLESGKAYTLEGKELPMPVNRAAAEHCKIWDTGHRLTNIPAMCLDENGRPVFVLAVSGETPWDCAFHCVRYSEGKWVRRELAPTTNTWSGCDLAHDREGRLHALLTVAEGGGGKSLLYGGGPRIEHWVAKPGSLDWVKANTLVPESGHLYNNPRFLETAQGQKDVRWIFFFGWPGQESLQRKNQQHGPCTAKAYLWQGGRYVSESQH